MSSSSSSSSSSFSPKLFNCLSTEFHGRSSCLSQMMEILLSGFHIISTDIWNKTRNNSIFSGFYYDFSLNKMKNPTTHSCIVNSSSNVQVLKSRPILIKPNPNVQNLEPEMIPPPPPPPPPPTPEQTHVTESDSGLSSQIEKLVSCKRYEDALELFEFFECEDDYELSKTTFDALVEACVELKSIKGVKRVFSYVTGRSDFEWDQYLRNRALLMHVKCGMMIDAQQLFDGMPERNVVSWNIIIGGLVSSGDYYEVFELFFIMRKQFSDVNARIFTLVIKACAGLEIVSTGSQLHGCVLKMGLGRNVFVSCVLIDMYCKCGRVVDAQIVFDEMPEKTLVGWNTIIAGYGLNGYSEEALIMYNKMKASGIKMDNFTCATIVRICSRLASVENVKQIHACLVRLQFGSDLVVNSALVDFYSKWGRIEDARRVFDNMPYRNLISWNALIDGYGNHGRGVEAVQLFERMLREGLVPNHLTFRAVLSASSYSGLSDVGWKIFESMKRDHKIKPRAMHYACMIRLLGKQGLLDNALALINDSPFSPTENMWAALLTACRVHKNLDLGKLAAEKLYEMEPEKLSNYVVLLNIYRSSGRSEKVAEVIETLTRRGLKMLPACSCIEIKKQPHFFHSKDSSHIQFREIHKRLIKVMHEIAKHGYVPGEKSLLSDVDEQEERKSSYHSEKLAVACGLINTPDSTSLQVVQSHRICNDCHHAIKLIALVTNRKIVVRDASRFHHFKNGTCSCLDYW